MNEHIPTPEDKKAARDVLDKPEHKKPKGSPEDEATRDQAIDDPALQAPE